MTEEFGFEQITRNRCRIERYEWMRRPHTVAVQRLGDGDSVAVSGSAAPHSWRDRQGVERLGLDINVHQVMSPYHAARKRPGRTPQDGEGTAG